MQICQLGFSFWTSPHALVLFSGVASVMLAQRCCFSDVASAMLAQFSRLSLLVIFVIHPFLTGKTEDRKDRNY